MITFTSCLLAVPFILAALQRGSADKTGLVSEKLEAANRLVEEEVVSGRVGAAALLVARNGVVALEKSYGRLSRDPGSPSCKPDSVFLVASISKPVTALAVMRLVEQGQIGLDDLVKNYFPGFTGGGRERITIRNLLTHTTGLPDMLPENIPLRKRQAPLKDYVSATLCTPLLFSPGSRVSYQSMGLLLAGSVVERVSGKTLDHFLQAEIFGPLKMRCSSMGLGQRKIKDTVRCELPASGELIMTEADRSWDWNSAYWRKLGAPWGGMHSSVTDIGALLQTMLEGGRPILGEKTVRMMVTDQNAGLDKPWGLGWKVGADAFYDGSPALAFGHEGATGTLCWADPARQLVFVLFTNRPLDNDKTNFLRRVSKAVSDAALP